MVHCYSDSMVFVDSMQIDDNRTPTVHVLPDPTGGCVSGVPGTVVAVEGWVGTRPRDTKIGPDRPPIVWRKRKWLCTKMFSKRKRFTESVPAVPPRRG